MEYAGDVSFNATRDVVTVTLTDNGIGDDDPVLGVIRDPGGLAPESVQPESGGITRENGSSGSGSMGPYLVVFLLLYAFVAVGRARD